MEYLIELHNVPFEIPMYVADLTAYGEITRHGEWFPIYVWLTSPWEQDIIEVVFGVKKVWPRRYKAIPLHPTHGRTWVDLMGTKWDEQS